MQSKKECSKAFINMFKNRKESAEEELHQVVSGCQTVHGYKEFFGELPPKVFLSLKVRLKDQETMKAPISEQEMKLAQERRRELLSQLTSKISWKKADPTKSPVIGNRSSAILGMSASISPPPVTLKDSSVILN